MNLNYKDTPFPYFYGSLDKKMYDYAHKLWSTDEDLKSYNISKNRSNIEITDKKLINYLTKVGAEVKSLSDNFGIFEKYYPKLKKKIQCNDLKFTYSENPITESNNVDLVIYKVQIAASKRRLELKSYNFKGLKSLSRVKDGSFYKYFYQR